MSLIKLKKAVAITNLIKPIQLPSTKSGDFVNKKLYAMGWGHKGSNTAETSLQHAELTVIANKNCAHIAYSAELLTTSLCAQGGKRNESICQGDSGYSPLILKLLLLICLFKTNLECEYSIFR